MDGDKPYQLRDAAEMIRKSDDSQKVVKGLELLPALIEAAPDELVNYSGRVSSAQSNPCKLQTVTRLLFEYKQWRLGPIIGFHLPPTPHKI